MISFAIVIATYQRKDGKTKMLLSRCLRSVIEQKYPNWKVFLIGDKYEDETEFYEITKDFPKAKLHQENLPVAKERDKYYPDNLNALWSFGGVNAINHGINIAVKEKFQYVINLDHDDYYAPLHLSNLADCIFQTGALFVCSKSKHFNNATLPNVNSISRFIDYIPQPASLVKSSATWNIKHLPFKFRNLEEIEGANFSMCGDMDLWSRMREEIYNKNIVSKLVNVTTCFHDEEQSIFKQ